MESREKIANFKMVLLKAFRAAQRLVRLEEAVYNLRKIKFITCDMLDMLNDPIDLFLYYYEY
jgi:hypothetical protein